jgi:hypothetical protein
VRPRCLELRAPRSSGEWARYHDIRKRCIFAKYNGKGSPYYCEYDPDWPDERLPANHPLMLLADDVVVGTIRIDIQLSERMAVFRLVARALPCLKWRRHLRGSAGSRGSA